MKSLEEKKVDGKLVFDGKVVKLCVDNVLLPDNSKSVREVVRHSGGAAVLLVDGDDVILVRQFRYAYNKELLEIPAGKLNLGEDPALAAQRELEEETGYKATLSHVIDIFPTPGYTDEIIRIYFASNPQKGAQKLDDGEFLRVERVPLKRALKMIDDGEICDAKTIAAIYKYVLINGVKN